MQTRSAGQAEQDQTAHDDSPIAHQLMLGLQRQAEMQQQQMAAMAELHQQQMAAMAKQMELMQKSLQSKGQRGEPPKFRGTTEEDLGRWIFLTEDHYTGDPDFEDTSSERFVIKVAANLSKHATSWYHGYATKAKAEGELRTWAHFKVAIKKQFEKVDPEYQVMLKLSKLKQRGSIIDHNAAFQELRSQIAVEDLPLRFWYTESLAPETKRYVLEKRAETLEQAMDCAVTIESILHPDGRKELTTPTKPSRGKPHGTATSGAGGKPSSDGIRPTCYSCGRVGHKKPECNASAEDKEKYRLEHSKGAPVNRQ